jgi:two-component system, NtrC family, nitrogen regulation sensor histidine kinase GlnL
MQNGNDPLAALGTKDRKGALRSGALPLAHDVLLHALPHPLLVLAPDNQIVFANFAAEVFFGISENVLRRRRADDLVTFASPLLALIMQVRQGRTTVNEYAVDLGLPDSNGLRSVDVFASPLPDYEDHMMVMLQQRSMAQLIERQLTHRGAARSVSGLAAVLAHEIKNPLSGIRGAAQLLEAGAPPDDRPLAQLICHETDRICNLVDRMEVFGDERPLKFEPVNIHTILDHVRQIAINGFARHITIHQSYDPSLPPVPGSRDKLIQAFLNLVKNAAEAIGTERTDGQITLSTAFRPGLRISLPSSDARVSLPLEITVMDNGPGIPDDLRPHLFEPFVTTKARGAGLGLALVAKILGDHGGIIECDAKLRQTIFRTMMPMYHPTDKRSREK